MLDDYLDYIQSINDDIKEIFNKIKDTLPSLMDRLK